ncbi:AAA family ATPase [Providencia rettgeri]
MNENYRLFFCSSEKYANTESIDNCIFIFPDRDNYNDFSLDSKVIIKIKSNHNKIGHDIYLKGYIGYLNDENKLNGKYLLQKIVNTQQEYLEKENVTPYYFFTMLRDLSVYRELVETFGSNESLKICKILQDITLSAKTSSTKKFREMALNTDIFNKSFIRTSESFFAFKNSDSILRGLEFENIGTISSNFTLEKNKNTPEISFNFDHESELPKRISIIIGENGIGKSQILKKIASNTLKGGNLLFEKLPLLDKKNRISLNRLLAFSPTNESKSTFPSDKLKKPLIWYKRLSLNRIPVRRGLDNTNDLIIQVARSKDRLFNKKRMSFFLQALSNLKDWEQLALITKDNETILIKHLNQFSEEQNLKVFQRVDPKKDPVRVLKNKEYPLSSGEISFVRFSAQMCNFIENGTLVLLDEPETHLHPKFISQFFALLDSLLKMTGSVAIIATHSVYFVREVFKEQVVILKRNDYGEVDTLKPRLSTFGADIGSISYFVFGENDTTQTLQLVKEDIIKNYKNWESIYQKFKDEMSINTLSILREYYKNKKDSSNE